MFFKFALPGYVVTLFMILIATDGAIGQLRFEDVSDARGLLPSEIEVGFGGGVAAFDYDEDGDIDLFLPQSFGNPDRLYKNDGAGNFQDIGGKSGLDVSRAGRSALWFDYDDDHRVDLLIASDCFNSTNPDCLTESTLRLYRQLPSGQFEDATLATGLSNAGTKQFFGHRAGICCGDIDRDGDIDLLVGQWEGELQLFVNESGVFVNQTLARGIINPNSPQPSNPWQSVMHDFNGDGWLDIYTAVDFFPNQLWLNQRDGTFENVAESSGTDFSFNDMGVTVGDYDNDGDFDIYVTNIFETGKHNVLLRNDSTTENVQFTEVSRIAGVDDTAYGWGATFFDANNDTRLDLAVTNGWFNGVGFQDSSRLFLNLQSNLETFRDVSLASGFDDDFYGSCLISSDLDRDGDLDLLQVCNPALFDGPFRILENQYNDDSESNWLVVRPRQADKNHWCLGAVVVVEIGDLKMMRSISAGTSIHGQEPAEAFFGLGDADTVDRVVIKWPFGDESVWENIPGNQIFDASDADLNLDGTITMADILVLRQNLGDCSEDCQSDLNHDGTVNRLDAIIMRSMFRRGRRRSVSR